MRDRAMAYQDDLLCAFARKDLSIVEELTTLQKKSSIIQDDQQSSKWWKKRITSIIYEYHGGGQPPRLKGSQHLVLQLVQSSGFIDVTTTSTMVDTGLALFGPSPSYKKFGIDTVDALGRARSWFPVGRLAGTAN